MKSLTTGLSKVQTLARLNLSDNPIGPDGAHHLGTLLEKCINLSEVDLHSCQLAASGAELIAKGVKGHPSLRVLNLRHNRIGERGGVAIAQDVISENNTLLELDISTNNIGPNEGAKAISEALEKNTKLEKLNLRHNNMQMALRKEENRKLQLAFRYTRIHGVWPLL
mmetsp:Transcript_15537/g.33499  ORF Transcript_15537/g.33499 Transcript_15537/m.33499 type:complete len:167 (+) Transcript_15537:838-1338(+)